MSQFLKMAKLVDKHGMPKMQVGSGGVEAGLDGERFPPSQFFAEFSVVNEFGTAAPDYLHLGINIKHRMSTSMCVRRAGNSQAVPSNRLLCNALHGVLAMEDRPLHSICLLITRRRNKPNRTCAFFFADKGKAVNAQSPNRIEGISCVTVRCFGRQKELRVLGTCPARQTLFQG